MRSLLLAPLLLLLLALVPAYADEADQAVLKKLEDTRVDLKLEEVDFATAIAALREAVQLNFVLDSRSMEAVEGRIVTLHLTKMRALHALRWLARAFELQIRISDGVISLAGADAAKDLMDLRLYDVTDILSQPRDFSPQDVGTAEPASADEVRELIERFITPGDWGNDCSLSTTGSTLVVQHTPQVHAQIERFLATLAAQAHFTVTFDARVLEFAPGAEPGLPALGALAPGRMSLTASEAAALLRRADGTVRVVEAARFTCLNGQRTSAVLTRTDGHPVGVFRAGPMGESPAQMVMEPRETALEVSSILVAGRDQVMVDLRARVADDDRASDRVETGGNLACAARASERRLRTSFQVANGGAALFVLGPAGKGVRALLVRVHSNAPAGPTSVPVESVQQADTDEQQFHALAKKPIDLAFNAMPLKTVAEELARILGINVVLDSELRSEGVSEVPVTLKLQGLEAETALQLLVRMVDLSYVFRDGALLLARRERAESSHVEVYDIRDLVWQRLQSPDMPLSWQQYISETRLAPESQDQEGMDPDELGEMLRGNIDSWSWDDERRASLAFFHGLLVVQQSPSTHGRIRTFLEGLRATKPRQVQFDGRVIELDAAVYDTLDASGDGPLTAGVQSALEKALTEGKGRVTSCVSVFGMHAQRMYGLRWQRGDYVQDWRQNPGPEPSFATLVGGSLFDVRPTIMSNQPGRMLVELHATICDLPEEFERVVIQQQTWAKPSQSRGEVFTTVVTRDGETRLFALGNVGTAGQERRRILVWTVKTVE